MKESIEKKVSEDNARSYSSIISVTGNVVKPTKRTKPGNEFENNKTIKEKIVSAIIGIGLIVSPIVIVALIHYLVNH